MEIHKYRLLSLFVLCGVMFAFISTVRAQQYDSKEKEGRFTLSLSGDGWFLWQDKQAEWKQDKLFLPEEITDLSRLPVNSPNRRMGPLTTSTC